MNSALKVPISRQYSCSYYICKIQKISVTTTSDSQVIPFIKGYVPFSVIADATASLISPEFPMHVVHPYPTILNPS
jgi:hypothetical protein